MIHTKGQNLAKRIRELFLDGKWIANTNYKQQLEDIDVRLAIYKLGKLNTLADLTFHLNYYLKGLLHAFASGELSISDKYSFETPSLTTEQAWQELKHALLQNAHTFALAIEAMSDEQLNSIFMKEQYGTYERNMEGVLEHGYYHLGQMVLIKKLILKEWGDTVSS